MSGTENHNADGVLVSNSEFLQHLYVGAPAGTCLWVTHFIGNPDGNSAWGGFGFLPGGANDRVVDRLHNQNTYFSVAALGTIAGDKTPRRRKANFARLQCLLADDAQPDNLLAPASWVLQTSPGKQQVGFFLEPGDSDCENPRLVDLVVTRMAAMGLIGGDLSGNNAVRYGRMPVGQNQKPRESGPFSHRMAQWRPEVRYTLDDACAALGIDLDELKTEAAKPVAPGTSLSSPIGGEQDEKMRVATANIIAGHDLHDSMNVIAASMVASGAHGGAIVNMLRALMESSHAPRDQRWQDRYVDIPRAVSTAEEKFRSRQMLGTTIDHETGEIVNDTIFVRADDMLANVKPIEFLVDQYLETNAISLLFGASGVGKSFVAIDQACCVATGTPWHKMPVKKGVVFYLAAEGHNGITRRLAAWSRQSGVSLAGAPLYVSKRAVMLSDANAVSLLVAEIKRLIGESKSNPNLVVVDTLQRNFGDGDENSTKDMSKFIASVDLAIQKQFKCHVMIVHHSGHDSDRARGSSALRASVDQEFQVTGKMGHLEYKNTKMKDAEIPVARNFKIVPVLLGTDPDGIDITGATIVPDGNPFEFEVGTRADGSKILAGDIVKAMLNKVEGYEAAAIALDASQRNVRRAFDRCRSAGLLEKEGRFFTLSEEAIDRARNMAWM